MIEIQVAGAGAGKTYSLAEKIIGCLGTDSHKKIFALTYTNSAKEKIEFEIRRRFGAIPDRVEIETVHTFLLNEIIYPFSPFVLGSFYTTASTVPLSSDDGLKRGQIKRLKDINILHVEEVYSAARRVVDKSHSLHNTKEKKAKVDRILKIVSACMEKIFLDEAQDLDETALRVFEVLGLKSVDIYMIGDPKQAIKFSGEFTTFIRKHEAAPGEHIKIHPPNNVTRRVPTGILNLSNKFCYPEQVQTSVSLETGFLKFIESTHPDFEAFVNRHIEEKSLVCIEKKSGAYSTKKYFRPGFDQELKIKLRDASQNRDPDIFVEAAEMIFFTEASSIGGKAAVAAFLKRYGITYTPQIYAQMMNLVTDEETAKFHISSIDAVKGLESDFCILILTPNTYNYLAQTGLKSGQRFNKEWKKIYVALTRAKREFIAVLDHELFRGKDLSINDVRNGLLAEGFKPYPS